MGQPNARDLARAVGKQAIDRGCDVTNPDDPSVAELVLQCWSRHLGRADVLVEADAA